ncbi:hypothetical protein GSY74_03555, partial [Sulfurovum sp. bin170]|uniref:hypothetical protein n=1 Tax=Sulfurovum sp. bin170 TaxID=2695268 RepID=UPI001417E563
MFKSNKTKTVLLSLLLLAGCSATSPKNETKNETKSSNSLQQEAVDAHNKVRAEVFEGAKVIWSDEIAATSQKYADHLASTGGFGHDTSKYGENLYA